MYEAHLPILRLALEEPRQVDEDGEDDDGRHVLEEPALARLGAVDHRDILFLVYHVIVYSGFERGMGNAA